MKTILFSAILCVLVASISSADEATNTERNATTSAATTNVLTQHQAASLAAQLANDECEKRFKRRPFTATSFAATYTEGRWCWGRLDPAGMKGYSAKVLFDRYGKNPEVQVYFSDDAF